jgi:molecular chaperone GrpE
MNNQKDDEKSPKDLEKDTENTTDELTIVKDMKTEKEASKEVIISENDLEKLRRDANDFKHKYLHQLADSENARKRLLKDREEIVQYSIRNILADFLDPIDHLENALKYTDEAPDEVKHWAIGFKMILSQFKDVLSNNGVKPIVSVGKEFDPHFHEAIEMVSTSQHPPGTVVQESMRGYTIGGKPLRPARVTVAKAPEEKIDDNDPLEEAGEEEKN